MMKLQLAVLILLVTSLVITEAYFLRLNNLPAYSRKRGSILEKKRISDKNFEGKFIVTSSTFTGIEKPKNNHNNHGYQKYDICQYRQISVQQQQFADVWPAALIAWELASEQYSHHATIGSKGTAWTLLNPFHRLLIKYRSSKKKKKRAEKRRGIFSFRLFFTTNCSYIIKVMAKVLKLKENSLSEKNESVKNWSRSINWRRH